MKHPVHGKPRGNQGIRCYQSHPPLVMTTDNMTFTIYGGSCIYPPKNVDVFVGLDNAMGSTNAQYPWTDGIEFKFKITDMSVPSNEEHFKELVHYLVACVKDGDRVYVGCIGGHGRTGMVLAAVYYLITRDKDAINKVRAKYCEKAVETSHQADWLSRVFGMSSSKGSKGFNSHGFGSLSGSRLDTMNSTSNKTANPDMTKPNIHYKK